MYSVSAKRAGLTAAAVSAALLVAACSSNSSSSSSTPTTPATSASASASSTGSASSVSISATGLTNTFSSMAALKPLVSAGKGNVVVILPDTVSSTRYVEFDAPNLKEAFTGRRAAADRLDRPERAGRRRHPVQHGPVAIT